MADKTITAANSIYMLWIPGVFPTPTRLQGYMADAAFETEAVEAAEVIKGVDGKMSAGFTPFNTTQTISVMPDNDTSIIFETWWNVQKVEQEIYYGFATISLPGIQRKYTMTRGVLRQGQSIPGVRKVLQGRPWSLVWDSVNPMPFVK